MLRSLGRGLRLLPSRSHLNSIENAKPRWSQSARTLNSGAYEGDGRTTVSSVNSDQAGIHLLIDAYSNVGFRLNNGMFVFGPIALFPRSLVQWNVESLQDVDEASLSLFLRLEPRLDVLVIGFGDKDNEAAQRIHRICAKHRIGLELQTTDNACATFNYLNAESRSVAAGLLPPTNLKIHGEAYTNPALERKLIMEEWGTSASRDDPRIHLEDFNRHPKEIRKMIDAQKDPRKTPKQKGDKDE